MYMYYLHMTGMDMVLNIHRKKVKQHSVSLTLWPGTVARSDARPPGMRTVAGSILTSGNILSWRLVMK